MELITQMRLESPAEKVVVFSSYSKTLQILELAVREDPSMGPAIAHQQVLIDGQTHGNDRTKILKAFREDPAMFVLLLSTKANNAGLTLTEASRFLSPSFLLHAPSAKTGMHPLLGVDAFSMSMAVSRHHPLPLTHV